MNVESKLIEYIKSYSQENEFPEGTADLIEDFVNLVFSKGNNIRKKNIKDVMKKLGQLGRE